MEEVKFYCECGQKVSVPAHMVDQVGSCPACDLPLLPPDDVISDHRSDSERRSRRGSGSGRSRRREATNGRASRRQPAPSGDGLPMWFYFSFALDATFFVVTWKAFGYSPVISAAAAEVGAWSLRIIGLKLNW